MPLWRKILLLVIFCLSLSELYEELTDEIHGWVPTDLEAIGLGKWVDQIQPWYDTYLDFHEWLDEVLPPGDSDWIQDEDYDDHDNGEVTIQLSDQPMGLNQSEYFTMSKVPRRIRTSKIMYKVGQLVQISSSLHEGFPDVYRENEGNPTLICVIIGWDKKLKAPYLWIEMMYGSDFESWLLEPHYALICDSYSGINEQEGDVDQQGLLTSSGNLVTHVVEGVPYVAQSEIKLSSDHAPDFRLLNPSTSIFFTGFSEQEFKYIMKPWLRKKYPKDA
ncbi:hypothetical protein TCAL_00999 [Tigriopus californicus]|uniref:Hemimethylated DNA-binding domain-containing protein n=1 Tax=Tigriopus californicus TaxID=6832 RepID=A0A553P315_TIGCA|nr:uncharacterized protein LOC131883749 [Tigriopus californicus]XP_059087284.1 uncharacterized protein LOC131883749 [Tigriopus californicus]TRY72073.1 hypothetical protein TCAL_00999 [Tigriopus californicus]|eukprot:TCALIF_00999-PA protein Name:"Protein of unknown function" AED:0.00 eAED:0.00 QI:17/1/1/1/1/1/3/15/274